MTILNPTLFKARHFTDEIESSTTHWFNKTICRLNVVYKVLSLMLSSVRLNL